MACVISAMICVAMAAILGQQTGDELAREFQPPPDSARPRVWWHWMNGSIIREGTNAGMDRITRAGIAGLQSFDAGGGPTQIVDERLAYMSPGWKEVFRKTAAYADQLGLAPGGAASPGWSEAGGPRVTARDARKKMSVPVARVRGSQPFTGTLPQPPATTGTFQASPGGWRIGGRARGQKPPEWYVDRKVTAFRVRDGGSLPAAAARGPGAPSMPCRAGSPLGASGLMGPVRVLRETRWRQ